MPRSIEFLESATVILITGFFMIAVSAAFG